MSHVSLTRIALVLAVIGGLLSQGPAALAGKPDRTAPAIPTGLTAIAASAGEVDLAWNASTDRDSPVAGYTVYRGGTKIATVTAPATTYADKSVSPSTTYSYTVDAFDPAGNHSAQSAPATVITPADVSAPTTPTGLAATAIRATEVDLSWNASTDPDSPVAGYTIYRGGIQLGIATAPATTYRDTTVSPSTTYSYTVDAFDGSSNHSSPSAPLSVTTSATSSSPIQHVVIIDMENHTFDNILGDFCVQQAAGSIQRAGLNMGCDGTDTGKLDTGAAYPMPETADSGLQINHSVPGQITAMDQGKMDGFDQLSGCTGGDSPPYGCLTTFRGLTGVCGSTGTATCIPNAVSLAKNFAISDRTFEFRQTPSWGGHLILGSATLDNFQGENPKSSNPGARTGLQGAPPWGCTSGQTTQFWGGSSFNVYAPSCVPDRSASIGPVWAGYTGPQATYVPTIFDRMDAGGVSWRIYGLGSKWSVCPDFWECMGSSQQNNVVSNSQLGTDAQNGTLPSMSLVVPPTSSSEHEPASVSAGDNWLGQTLTSLQTSPNWSSMAIFITWDDCGCFYDHVNPLQFNPEWGIRVPLIIVSPYAKAGYTDSNPATFLSMMAFIEHTFGLQALHPCATVSANDPNCTDDVQGVDGQPTYDFSNAFNYSQAPKTAVKMTHTVIPAKERAWLAAHPLSPEAVT